jgi:PAS domain S-box-containing protein
MIEAAPVAMLLVDRGGTVLLVNNAAEQVFGFPRAALLGQSFDMLVPAAGDIADRRATGAGRDAVGVRADGSEFPVEIGLNPIATPDGECLLAVVADMSERARAESARAHLAAIVDSSHDAIIGKTLEGIVTSWNRAAETMLGWPEWEMLGQPILRIIPPDRREEEAHILARICAGGRVEDLATVRLRRDGKLIPVSVTVSPIRDRSGRVVGASKIMRDATVRRRGEREMQQANAALELAVAERTRELAEQQDARLRAEAALAQSQKLEAVGQLTGGIAHDFNNLLTVVAGNNDIIRRQAEGNERLARASDSIARAVERGARLTGHLLAFARRQTLQPEIVRLDHVLAEFSLLVMRALGESIRMSIDAGDDLWSCLLDRAQFESAVLNLAINARDAMLLGGVLSITLRNCVEDGQTDLPAGRYVAVCVADSGVGMSAEVVARAVEPFFTTKSVGRGSGLGLSQVYGFVQQSGGSLRIDSRPDAGTRVTMLFPAAQEAPTDAIVADGALI